MSPLEILNEMRTSTSTPAARINWVYDTCAVYSYSINPKPDIKDTSAHFLYLEKQLIQLHAQWLYCRHLHIERITHHFMWKQCAEEYRSAWICIAEADAEAPELEEGN